MFFGTAPVGWRWGAARRSAIAFGLPALVAVALGYPQQALLITIGAFAVLYGESRPYRVRWWVVLSAGAALFVAAGAGAVLAEAVVDSDRWVAGVVQVAMLTLVGVVGAYVVDAARLGPPGAFFFVLAAAVGWLVSKAGISMATILGCVAIGVFSSVIVAMAGKLTDRRSPERVAVTRAERAVDAYVALRDSGAPASHARHDAGAAVFAGWDAVHDAGAYRREAESEVGRSLAAAHARLSGAASADPAAIPLPRPSLRYRLRRALTIDSHAATTAIRVGAGCVVGGGLSVALGLGRPDWTIIAATLVLHQGLDRPRGTVRGLHRFVGTTVGLGLFAALHALAPTGYVLIVLLMVLQFAIELFIARNYGIAVIFITPVALLIGGGGHTNAPIGPVVGDRFIETALGVVVSLAVLWLVFPHAHRRTLRWTQRRIVAAAAELLDVLAVHSVHSDRSMELRRDMQFELIGGARAGADAAHNELAWTEEQWPAHAAVGAIGYDLLAECWSVPPEGLLPDVDSWTRKFAHLELG